MTVCAYLDAVNLEGISNFEKLVFSDRSSNRSDLSGIGKNRLDIVNFVFVFMAVFIIKVNDFRLRCQSEVNRTAIIGGFLMIKVGSDAFAG